MAARTTGAPHSRQGGPLAVVSSRVSSLVVATGTGGGKSQGVRIFAGSWAAVACDQWSASAALSVLTGPRFPCDETLSRALLAAEVSRPPSAQRRRQQRPGGRPPVPPVSASEIRAGHGAFPFSQGCRASLARCRRTVTALIQDVTTSAPDVLRKLP